MNTFCEQRDYSATIQVKTLMIFVAK